MIYVKDVEGEYVLLVENDVMLLATTQSVLSDAGYKVASCSAPEEAITICEEHRRARVVLSRVIFSSGSPLTGIHVARSARRACGAVTVLTDHHDPALLYGLKGFDRHPFLPQPYTRQQLIAAVAEAWWNGNRPSVDDYIPPDEEPSSDSGYPDGAGWLLPGTRAAHDRADITPPPAPAASTTGAWALPC